MIKLVNLLNEIKIQNPNTIFHITDKGKEALTNYNIMMRAAGDLGLEIVDYLMDDRNFSNINLFNIFGPDGERMIDIKNNTIESYLERYRKIWDDDDESAKIHLRMFINKGWITPIEGI